MCSSVQPEHGAEIVHNRMSRAGLQRMKRSRQKKSYRIKSARAYLHFISTQAIAARYGRLARLLIGSVKRLLQAGPATHIPNIKDRPRVDG